MHAFKRPFNLTAKQTPRPKASTSQFLADADVRQRLSEVIAWCGSNARLEDPAASTRTSQLTPPGRTSSRWLINLMRTPGAPAAAVDFIREARLKELQVRGIAVRPVASDLAGGRLLYSTLNTDECGAATEPSNGLFDELDLPGWDTWFHHAATAEPWGAIYCWIPGPFIPFAQGAITVIPVQCVQWLEP